ncbi:MAG: hypothetical protein M5U27_03015 [Gaiella sp.]|nr:hypothetical protein [Gaiella sp.]
MEVRAEIVRLGLAETFVISRESQDWADVVHVTLRHGEVEGRGEAAPIERYGETAESALAFLERHGGLVGDDPFALEGIGNRLGEIDGEQAAKAALDAALHDLQGSSSASPSTGCSASRARARRPRGPCGSATRTTWPVAPPRPPRGSGVSSSSSAGATAWTSSASARCVP